MVGEKGLYPSRSELIRVAIREFLIRELETAASINNLHQPAIQTPVQIVGEDMFVRVPLTPNADMVTMGKTEQGYKIYHIVKK